MGQTENDRTSVRVRSPDLGLRPFMLKQARCSIYAWFVSVFADVVRFRFGCRGSILSLSHVVDISVLHLSLVFLAFFHTYVTIDIILRFRL